MKQELSSVRLPSAPSSGGRRTRITRAALAAALGLALALSFGAAVVGAGQVDRAGPAGRAGPAAPADPAGAAHGHVIVQFGDRDLAARAISFTAPISGLAALQLTGLNVVTASTTFGPFVCSIEGVGCPASDCFCDSNAFWNYNTWDGAAWQGYLIGASASELNDGAVEGWRWGAWGSAMQPARPVTAAVQALDWLELRQSAADGGFGGAGATVEALLAFGANNIPGGAVRREPGSPTALDYLAAKGAAYVAQGGVAAAGKLAVALTGAGGGWPDGVAAPTSFYDADSGAFSTGGGPQAWGMLGARAQGQCPPARSAWRLRSMQQSNGGWEWAPGWGADTNTTALALQAMLGAGEPLTSPAVVRGLAYLKSAQNDDGGFTYDPASPYDRQSDANSTAYVVQALLAAAQDPSAPAWIAAGGDPVRYLLDRQLPDGSLAWRSGGASNLVATEQAIAPLLGRPYPLRSPQPAQCSLDLHPVYVPVVSR